MLGMFASPLARQRHPFAIDESGALGGFAGMPPGFGEGPSVPLGIAQQPQGRALSNHAPGADPMRQPSTGAGGMPLSLPGSRQVGVMADEVAQLRPDALGPTVNGFQTVNYGQLGRRPPQGMFASHVPQGPLPDMMRPINDALAENQVLGDQRKAKRKKTLHNVGQAVAAGLNGYLAAMGNQAGILGLQNMHAVKMAEAEQAAKLEMERQKLAMPRIEQVGDSLGYLDPATGTFSEIYRDPQAFEAYALSQGLQPGTPEYREAIENYRLGAWSDPAMENRINLEGVRFGHRGELQADRYERMGELQDERLETSRRNTDVRAGVSRENNIRTTGTSRDNNIRSTNTSRDNSVRSNETRRGAHSYQNGGRRGRGGGSDLIGPVYVKDGKRIQYSKSRRQYVPVQ